MVRIHYHDDHKYFNPLIHRIEGCIEHQEGYYADEAACVEYSPETGILLVNDSPVEMSNAVSIFFTNYHKQFMDKPLHEILLPHKTLCLTMPDPDDDKPGFLCFAEELKPK